MLYAIKTTSYSLIQRTDEKRNEEREKNAVVCVEPPGSVIAFIRRN